MPRKQQQHGATTATSERVVMPGKSFVVGLGVTTVVSLNCFLCVMVARKAFLLPSFAVQDAEDGDRPEHSGVARSGEGAHHRTAPVFHAAAAHRASTASDGRGSRTTAAGPTLCSTTAMCERLEAYLGDTLDRDKDPCDDFYGYVCSRRRGRVEAPLPVQSQGSSGLLYGIQRALSHYVASHKQAYQDFPGVFLNKAAYFLPNCTSTYSRNRLGWEPWQDVLKMADLQDWPHRRGLSLGDSRVSDTAAKIDALLGVFPFVQVRVKSEYERCCAVQLDAPSTVFKRHALWHARDPAPNYTDTVFGALTLLGYVPGSEELARDVAVLEMRLENALDLRGGPSFGGNRPRAPGELPVSRRSWHWRSYLETLLAGTASDARNGTSKGGGSSRPAVGSVEVWASEYLQDLAEVMENSSRTALFNYVGYRLMVHLSPLLPDDAAFLVPLSHEHAVRGGSDRLQACGRLLERLFPFGTRTFLRMVLSAQNQTHRPSQMEAFMEETFNDTRRLLAERVMFAHWFNPVERVIAREKLADAQFAFMGAVRDLNVPTAYYDPNGPYFDGTRLVRSYVEMQAHTRRIYYRPMTVGRVDWDFDNRYHVSSLRPGYEFVQGRNLLFVPYGVLGLARGATGELGAALEPAVAPFLLRGLLEAVDERGAGVDHRRRTRNWWSRTARKSFGAVKDCFFGEYKAAMQTILDKDVDVVRDMSALVAESLLLEPLYARYLRRLAMDAEAAHERRSPVAGHTFEQLFYVLYATAQCESRPGIDQRRVSFGEAPARARVNVALRNHRPFAAAFGCQRGHDMRPKRTCPSW
ncbi:neprilysin-1-like [Dermacentor variabilis]|uniref:neprilysin-1-like n=1 Tax=Dermacentor variabilis TaxID=34621 RepID=UPI003F5B2F23